MTNEDKDKLLELLKIWFTDTDFSYVNIWHRNKIAEFLKTKLNKMGYWKSKRRGNPAKGRKEYLKRKNRGDYD